MVKDQPRTNLDNSIKIPQIITVSSHNKNSFTRSHSSKLSRKHILYRSSLIYLIMGIAMIKMMDGSTCHCKTIWLRLIRVSRVNLERTQWYITITRRHFYQILMAPIIRTNSIKSSQACKHQSVSRLVVAFSPLVAEVGERMRMVRSPRLSMTTEQYLKVLRRCQRQAKITTWPAIITTPKDKSSLNSNNRSQVHKLQLKEMMVAVSARDCQS